MPHSNPSLRRRTILITGASSGIGAGLARRYASAGHDLALCARSVDKLETLKTELLADNPTIRVEIRALNVDDAEAVSNTFEDLDQKLDGLDRVIVNAGLGSNGAIGQGHRDANIAIARTNFVGALAQIDAALAIMRRRGKGHLVLISSVAAIRALPGASATYSATKVGLASLGESLATEYSDTTIKISTIFPGYIRTPLNAHKGKLPFEVDEATGVKAIMAAIDKETTKAFAPNWPWWLVAHYLRHLPASVLKRRFA